jgi:hypothetical protein
MNSSYDGIEDKKMIKINEIALKLDPLSDKKEEE